MGSDWILNKPVNLVANQEIVFSDGVVIQAMKDKFHGTNDSLFVGSNLTNLTMRGEGNATLRMRKADYQDTTKYTRAEWRMGIKLYDCTNVVVKDFTIAETGGDGLYLGAGQAGVNKNVLVENMTFDANHRLGMAVISADGLIIRHCKFINTLGTPPGGGLDLEPNTPQQQLKNISIEDCNFDNNSAGSGIDFAPTVFTSETQPVSVTFKRCHISGNSKGLAANASRGDTKAPVTGTVTFVDCTFDHNKIELKNPVKEGIQYLFQNCTLDYSPTKTAATPDWKSTPISIICDAPPPGTTIGGAHFENTTVIDDTKKPPVEILFQGPGELSDDFSGKLSLKRNGATTMFDVADFAKTTEAEHAALNARIKAQKPATVDLNSLQAPATGAARAGNKEFYLQGAFTFLQYAQKGQQITIDATVRKVYPKETSVELIAPSGKKLGTYTLPLTNQPFPITFTADETGLYRVVRTSSFSQRVDVTSANPGNGVLADGQLAFLPIAGKLYFEVPAGVKDFNIGVSTATTGDVALLNASGKEVERHDNVNSMQLFSGHRTDASRAEIWSLSASNAAWVVNVTMYAPLAPIVSTNPATLLRVK